jgi:hypothetical protein
MTFNNNTELLMYQTEDGKTKIEVRMEDETVWLSLNQMAELFQRDKSVISRHIKNIFSEGELDEKSVVANFATTAADGKTYNVDYYNLDVIISVGYRVKSHRGTQFRIWATQRLKEYIIKGFTMNDDLCDLLAEIDVTKFSDFINDPVMKGRKVSYFSRKYVDRKNEKMKNIDIYVWTNLSANSIRNLIRKLLRKFDIKLTDYYVYLRADYTPLHKSDKANDECNPDQRENHGETRIGKYVRQTLRELSKQQGPSFARQYRLCCLFRGYPA